MLFSAGSPVIWALVALKWHTILHILLCHRTFCVLMCSTLILNPYLTSIYSVSGRAYGKILMNSASTFPWELACMAQRESKTFVYPNLPPFRLTLIYRICGFRYNLRKIFHCSSYETVVRMCCCFVIAVIIFYFELLHRFMSPINPLIGSYPFFGCFCLLFVLFCAYVESISFLLSMYPIWP